MSYARTLCIKKIVEEKNLKKKMKKRKQVARDGRPGRLEQPRAELVSRV
jgi:hypothetical protein